MIKKYFCCLGKIIILFELDIIIKLIISLINSYDFNNSKYMIILLKIYNKTIKYN